MGSLVPVEEEFGAGVAEFSLFYAFDLEMRFLYSYLFALWIGIGSW